MILFSSMKDDVTVTDTTRLKAIVPTAKYLLSKGANVILCSHFGRPKGEIIEKGKRVSIGAGYGTFMDSNAIAAINPSCLSFGSR